MAENPASKKPAKLDEEKPEAVGKAKTQSAAPAKVSASVSEPPKEDWSVLGTAGLVGGVLGLNELVYWLLSRRAPYKKVFTADMVYVYQFRRTPTIPSLSPKCMAMETWLRIAKVQYENVTDNPWLHEGVNSVLPFVEINGKQFSGLQNVINEITATFNLPNYEARIGQDLRDSLEGALENLMWCFFYFRCVQNEKTLLSPENIGNNLPTEPVLPWSTDVLFKMMVDNNKHYQSGEREKIAKKIVKDMKERLELRGFKTERKIRETGFECLMTFSETLGEKKFLFDDDRPFATDAFLFGLTAQIFYGPYKSPFKKYMKVNCRNLLKHCRDVKNLLWPDWENLTNLPL